METHRPGPEHQGFGSKMRKAGEIALLAAVLAFSSPDSASAQTKEGPEKPKEKIGQLIERSKQSLGKVLEYLAEKGQAGIMGKNTPIKRWKSPDKQKLVEAGYGTDKKTSSWVYTEEGDGAVRYFDNNSDGSVDRAVYNKSNKKGVFKHGENDLQTFDSMKNLEAAVGLEQGNIVVVDFTYSPEGQLTLHCINYDSGDNFKLTGEEAEAYMSKVQDGYTGSVEAMAVELYK